MDDLIEEEIIMFYNKCKGDSNGSFISFFNSICQEVFAEELKFENEEIKESLNNYWKSEIQHEIFLQVYRYIINNEYQEFSNLNMSRKKYPERCENIYSTYQRVKMDLSLCDQVQGHNVCVKVNKNIDEACKINRIQNFPSDNIISNEVNSFRDFIIHKDKLKYNDWC